MKEIIEEFYEKEYYKTLPTELCVLMNKYGSDKGTQNKGRGNYTKLYNFLFSEIKDKIKNVFEVGLGTNYTDVPSSMGIDGVPGASLRGWREYFTNANIYGADLDRRILFQEERIKTFFVNQFDKKTINDLWFELENIEFDIIIDDGIHDVSFDNKSGNKIFFENSIHKLKKNGFYIIEDVAIDSKGDNISELALSFVNELKSGDYGHFNYVKLVKVPAFDDNGGFRNTQIILIKK